MTVAARVYFHQTSRESMGVIFSPAADGPALHVRAGPLSRPRALAAALGARTPWRPFGPLAFTQPGHRQRGVDLRSLYYNFGTLPYSLGEQTSISCATPKQSLPLFSGFGLSQVLHLV